MPRKEVAGAAPRTSLSGAITNVALSMTLSSGTGYPTGASYPFVLVIDPGLSTEEKVLCTSRSGTSVTIDAAGRGYDSTTAQSHADGAYVEHVLDAASIEEFFAFKYDAGAVGTTNLAANAVTTAKITDSNVTTAKINDLAVTTAKINDDAVTSAKIVADAVGSSEIAALAVTAAQLAADAVTTAKILDANVTEAKLATDAVTAAKIAADAVGTSEIAALAVTAAKLAADAVTTAKILDANVTTAKIADTAVTAAKLDASLPKGTVYYAEYTTDHDGIDTAGLTFATSGSVALTTGRRYRFTGHVNLSAASAGNAVLRAVVDGGLEAPRLGQDNNFGTGTILEGSVVFTASTGTHTFALNVQTISGLVDAENATDPAWILVEDIGAA